MKTDSSLPTAEIDEQRSPLAVLRRFGRTAPAVQAAEKCELCSLRLAAEHEHLLDLRNRRLVCSCQACAVLFGGRGSAYCRVERVIQPLPNFRLADAQWESLLIPINLAFFYRTESPPPPSRDAQGGQGARGLENDAKQGVPHRVVAVYPSPAGPIQSLLELDAWQAIVDDNPRLSAMRPEVEALLVNRLWGRYRYYLVSIDQCFRLSGLIRRNWRGLSGGSEVWEEVERFFDRLEEKSCSI